MNEKINKKTITAIIAVLLIVVLAITLASFLNKPMIADAAENVLKATYAGTHGQLTDVEGGHRTDEQAKQNLVANYGASESMILKITTGQQLYEFINGESLLAGYTHAYLANDVGIAYSGGNGAGLGYDYTTNKNSSGAIFDKVLDGNGYTLNLWGGVGYIEYTEYTDNYFSAGNTLYRYSGLFAAINRGTIANLVIDYKSNHGGITATTGNSSGINIQPGFLGADADLATGLFNENGLFGVSAGIVVGMNGEGGNIDNVRLNVNGNFKVIDFQGGESDMYYNCAFVGGFAGRAGKNSNIKNSQINIADNAGVYSGVEGPRLDNGLWDGWGLAVAGGLVGKMDKGMAETEGGEIKNSRMEYCAVTGGGTVKAYVSRASGKNGSASAFRAYSGGAIGACLNIVSNGSLADGGKDTSEEGKHILNIGQVNGIISDWTGLSQNNYDNVDNVSYSQMFGSVGQNVGSCALLFDLISYRQGKGVDINNEENISLDSHRSNVVDSWLGMYPKTEGGEVIVRLVGDETSKYDFRIHAIANNSPITDQQLLDENLGTTDGKMYTLQNGQTGNIIWKATFGTTERISLMKSMPTYAESKLVTSKTSANYEYSFGNITTISYENTNGTTLSKRYEGKKAVLNKPGVVAASGVALENYSDNEWTILRNGVATNSDMSGTALPGAYVMSVQAEEQTYIPLGYYSDSQRMAAWKPSDNYKFNIIEGVLSYGNGTVVTEDWSKSADFELMMNSEEDFDFIRYVRNGTIVMDSAEKFVKNGNIATIKIEESTGKNGMAYSFIAYAKDGDKDVIVARTNPSEDKNVKIDNETPEISEVLYYTRNAKGEETPILESDLSTWRTDRVVARYNVIDTKSGIKFAPSSIGESGIKINNTKLDDGSYDVEVIVSKNAKYVITYTDNNGNTYPFEIQANVDYMTALPSLAYYTQTYPVSDYGYSTRGARIRFNPTVGCSDWQLQYSWKKNTDGSDVWEDAMAQDSNGNNLDQPYILKGSAQQSFLINWNMGDPVSKEGAEFKMRIVNLQGLYEDVYLSKGGIVTDNGYVGKYCINYKRASIYVDNAFSGVKVKSDDGFNGRTVADIIKTCTDAEFEKIFNKVYDATDKYVGRYEFYIDIAYGTDERMDPAGYAEQNGIGILYTPAYIAYPDDIYTQIKVELRYEQENASNSVKLYATFAPESLDGEKYDLYFADNSKIDFDNAYIKVDESITSVQREVPATTKIKVYEKTVDLELDVDGFKNVYYYGETVPQTVEANIGIKDYPITVKLTSQALQIVGVGDYDVSGEVITPLGGNMKINVKSQKVKVAPLPVPIDITMDGDKNIPVSVPAGKSHLFKATYQDINGVTQEADVKLDMGDETHVNEAIFKKGQYTITVSIDKDKNYIVKDGYIEDGSMVNDGTYKFFFSIRQGKLELAMGVNVVEYNDGNPIHYNPGIPADLSEGLFSRDDLSYVYYPYLPGAEYDAINKTVKGEWDRENPMGVGEFPIEIGFYHVEVSYKGNEAFFAEEYSGDMNVVKAKTQFEVEDRVKYAYALDDNKQPIYRTYDYVQSLARLRTVGTNFEIWNYAAADSSLIVVKYYDSKTGKFEPIGNTAATAGWHFKQGDYTYLLEFIGDEHYEGCTLNVVMTITPAEFQNIIFEGVEGVYNGENFVKKLDPKVPYSEARVQFRFQNVTYDSLSEIDIRNAGEHIVSIIVSHEGYTTYTASAKVIINKAKITGITAVPVVATYDGYPHVVTFNGFDTVGGAYQYSGFPVKISAIDMSEGNDRAVNAGNYHGQVRISVANHEDLILDTIIQIDKAEIVASETLVNLPRKLPSGMSVSNYYGAYSVDGGERVYVNVTYKDEAGNVVLPNGEGILPDGKYTVTLDVGNNHFINKSWTFIVGEINESKLTAPAIVAVVAVALVMVAAIITSVVVVNKRNKQDVIE